MWNKINKKFLLYLFRWQLSSPILFLTLYFVQGSDLFRTVLANLIGGILFYQVDKFLFEGKDKNAIN
jgi:hypothetical protein